MLDPISTAAASALLQAVSAATLSKIAKGVSSTSDKVKLRLESTFRAHLQNTYSRCRKVRTIFSNQNYIDLSSIYVNLKLTSPEKTCRDDDILKNPENFKNIVIVGTGGAGKTMLMRYLSVMTYDKPSGRIPLFIELRLMPQHEPKDFYKTIYEMITPEKNHGSYSVFLEGLRAGLFMLQLDGLDEIPPTRRDEVFRCIQRIPLDFPDVQVIASTRPEIDTRNWDFVSYKVNGLTLQQVKMLIEKIEYPHELKSKFIQILDEQFYIKHRTFLEIPLLCTLMLLTFNEYHEIPSRVTVFYEQAFETLFRRHDTAKEGFFNRTFSSSLSSDRFRLLFSAFCYRTLALNKVSFTDSELRTHISKSAKVTEIDVDVDCYASDLVSSICMIMRDGLNLHFIHRSFQDYFAALYILKYRGPDTFDVYDRVMADSFISNIAQMAADIDIQTLEREWVLPAIATLDRKLKRVRRGNRENYLIKLLFHDLRIDGFPPSRISGWSWISGNSDMRTLRTLATIYPSLARKIDVVAGLSPVISSRFE